MTCIRYTSSVQLQRRYGSVACFIHVAPNERVRSERVVERDLETGDDRRRNAIAPSGEIREHVTDGCHGAVTPCDFVGETARFQGLRSRMS